MRPRVHGPSLTAWRWYEQSANATSAALSPPRRVASKHINRAVTPEGAKRRRGAVFPDRFHQEIIETPRQARHALAYVLNNWRKHREDLDSTTRRWKVDPFSTGALFTGWKEREGADFLMRWRKQYQPMVVYLPKTWLLNDGWRRHGLIRYAEVPSTKRN